MSTAAEYDENENQADDEDAYTDEDYANELALLNVDNEGQKHVDSEGVWLLSYADLMTLLMGFFALMTSLGSFEEQKFNDVGDETAKYFGGEIEEPYKNLGDAIEKLIGEKQLSTKVQTQVNKTHVAITFEGTLFFDSGNIVLKDQGQQLMNQIIDILRKKAPDNKFLIEGHTDDIPIRKRIIASNWELSALRASAVARLFEQHGISRKDIMTIGFGDTRPVVANRDANNISLRQNQAKNRRVIIKVMRELPL